MRSAKPAYCTWPSPRASHSAGLFSSVAEPPTCRVTDSKTFTGVALPDTGCSTRSPGRYSFPGEKVFSAVLKNRSPRGVQNELLLNDDAVLACLRMHSSTLSEPGIMTRSPGIYALPAA